MNLQHILKNPVIASLSAAYDDEMLEAKIQRELDEEQAKLQRMEQRKAEALDLYNDTRAALGEVFVELGVEFFPQHANELPLITVCGHCFLYATHSHRKTDGVILMCAKSNNSFSSSDPNWIIRAIKQTDKDVTEKFDGDVKDARDALERNYDQESHEENFKEFALKWGDDLAQQHLGDTLRNAIDKCAQRELQEKQRKNEKAHEQKIKSAARQALFAAIESDDVAIALIKLFAAIQKEREEWQEEIENANAAASDSYYSAESAQTRAAQARDEAERAERRARDAESQASDKEYELDSLNRKMKRAGVSV